MPISYDRYSKNIRKAWKAAAAPGAGLIFDLGPHVIDQALDLFGLPHKITAFLQNIRGIGDDTVDDTVSFVTCGQEQKANLFLGSLKFTIIMHYDKRENNPYPLTTTIKAHSLSLRNPQLKFLVRGDNGTFVKYGVDVQEDQVSANGAAAFSLAEYGLDPNDAELEHIKDGVPIKEKCVAT